LVDGLGRSTRIADSTRDAEFAQCDADFAVLSQPATAEPVDSLQLAGSSGQIRLWSMNCNAEAVTEARPSCRLLELPIFGIAALHFRRTIAVTSVESEKMNRFAP
jgi:hypothetical protein